MIFPGSLSNGKHFRGESYQEAQINQQTSSTALSSLLFEVSLAFSRRRSGN